MKPLSAGDFYVDAMNMTPLSSSGSFIERAFKGRLPLWKVFWLGFLPLLLALYFAYIASLWALLKWKPMADVATFALSFSSIALLLIATSGFIVWRNAGNSTARAWKYLARIVVAIYLLWYARRAVGLWLVLGPHGI